MFQLASFNQAERISGHKSNFSLHVEKQLKQQFQSLKHLAVKGLCSQHLTILTFILSGSWWGGCWYQEAIPSCRWHSGGYRRSWSQLWGTPESLGRRGVQQICQQNWCIWNNSKKYCAIYLWKWRCQEVHCMSAVWRVSQKVWDKWLWWFIWMHTFVTIFHRDDHIFQIMSSCCLTWVSCLFDFWQQRTFS